MEFEYVTSLDCREQVVLHKMEPKQGHGQAVNVIVYGFICSNIRTFSGSIGQQGGYVFLILIIK